MSGPHVVIVGAGFGGLSAARALADAPVAVTIVDRHNYHLFQPLLYQVATAGLSPADIAHPVRAILRGQANTSFRLGDVTAVDLQGRTITVRAPGEPDALLHYDALILAVGGRTNFFGNAAIEQNALDLKDIDDAIAIRDQVLTMFERASHEPDRIVRQALLTFVVAGGGPTGVESAGALSELIRLVLVRDFPQLDVEDVRVILVEGSSAILEAFPAPLRERAVRLLRRKSVDVRLGAHVAGFDGRMVTLRSGESIPARTLVWAAGVQAAELVTKLDLARARHGRVVVEPTLQVPGHPTTFVIGDAAYLEDDGQPLPMVAQVAMQQGRVAARNAAALLRGAPLTVFEYRDPGALATIGRGAAVARIFGVSFSGFPAWVIWGIIHIFQLIGFRNRIVVMINWIWDYFLYERAVRLIFPKPPPPR